MRAGMYILATLVVMLLAFWAYRENYATQQAVDRQTAVQNEIAALRESLNVLRAEWAYLNRPERLKSLVDLNYDKLRLVPIQPGQYVGVNHVDYPANPPKPDPVPSDPAADAAAFDALPGEPVAAPRPPRREETP